MYNTRQKLKSDNRYIVADEGIQLMNVFPGSPRLVEGAIVEIDPFDPPAGVIISRCNLETPRARTMYGG